MHHLVTDKKVRIKCKDLVQNLSLYRNKLAVQRLPPWPETPRGRRTPAIAR